MSREVMQQALEALKLCLVLLERADCSTGYCCCGIAIDSHVMSDGHSPVDEGDYHQHHAMNAARDAIARMTPLYTTPPVVPKPLTIEEINALPEAQGYWPMGMNDRIVKLVRAVEAEVLKRALLK